MKMIQNFLFFYLIIQFLDVKNILELFCLSKKNYEYSKNENIWKIIYLKIYEHEIDSVEQKLRLENIQKIYKINEMDEMNLIYKVPKFSELLYYQKLVFLRKYESQKLILGQKCELNILEEKSKEINCIQMILQCNFIKFYLTKDNEVYSHQKNMLYEYFFPVVKNIRVKKIFNILLDILILTFDNILYSLVENFVVPKNLENIFIDHYYPIQVETNVHDIIEEKLWSFIIYKDGLVKLYSVKNHPFSFYIKNPEICELNNFIITNKSLKSSSIMTYTDFKDYFASKQ